jgi:hypothetical protein
LKKEYRRAMMTVWLSSSASSVRKISERLTFHFSEEEEIKHALIVGIETINGTQRIKMGENQKQNLITSEQNIKSLNIVQIYA